MKTRTMFAGVMATGLSVAVAPFGCGGAQEEYEVVSRPREQASVTVRQDGQIPDVTARQITTCIERGVARLPRSSATRYKVEANDEGQVKKIELRDSTVQDIEVESCIREAIAAMKVPDRVLRGRSSRPVSGGESITREQRGPLGSGSDSENPMVLWLFVEAVGVDVSIEVLVGAFVAVAAIVTSKNIKDECADKYADCMGTPLGNLVVDVHGKSLCATCQRQCLNDEAWPSAVRVTHRWHSCRY